MRRLLAVAGAAGVILTTSGFLVLQRSAQQNASPGRNADSEANQRFVIYDPGGMLPMLLDTQTGKSWYRAMPKDEARMVWVPITVANPNPDLNYSLPDTK